MPTAVSLDDALAATRAVRRRLAPIPLAPVKGDPWRPARRRPLDAVLHVDAW